MPYSVNVRTLAEFAFEGGDLAVDFSAVERMREGMEGHLTLQRQLDDTWRTEEPQSIDMRVHDIDIRVQGRADAVRRYSGGLVVEEIKTTRRNPSYIGETEFPVHWAQAEIYAAIICKKENYDSAEVALIYYNINGARNRMSRRYSASRLWTLLNEYLAPYARWLMAMEEWRGRFMPSVAQMRFPFDNYRDGQRQMAANAYVAARDHHRVMIEAPTGIGKTAAALFGALKAMGEARVSAIFYLTARTTGRRSAENALEIMRQKGLSVRSVTITAKEKACFPGDANCRMCPYSLGYYDRRREVLMAALKMEKLGFEEIRALAEENQLCPFELSLDLAESADVIICDYNYVFDPRVRLSRFFTRKNGCVLLVDEAHNLSERARDMLTAELSGREIGRLRRDIGKEDPLYPALTKMLRALKAEEDFEGEVLTRAPDKIAIAAEDLMEALTDSIPPGHPEQKRLVRLLLDCTWYARRHGEFSENESRVILEKEGKLMRARLMCVDPAAHIDKCLKKVGSAVFFSATLTPPEFYARQLAVSEDNGDAVLNLASPFPPENQLTLLLRSETRYAHREESLSGICRGIYAMMSGKTGNYIACFPSYAYMNMAFERFSMMYPDVRLLRQQNKMSDMEREAFIAEFQPSPRRSMLAFIALGGVFAEGVDLPDDRLSGAAIISVGIPLICIEREIIREFTDDGEGAGYDFAYTYPGFRRVQQAAGRVIRTETDRGIVLLMDERFVQEKYVNLMPPHWNVRVLPDENAVAAAAKRFWNN